MKIALIQVWIGKIPDYFWFHYETTKNLKNIVFFFFTDQDLELTAKNYFVHKIDKNNIEKKLSIILGYNFKLLNNKKTCDLKASYGDLFYDYIKDYDYFGCYDIDTLFGDINKFINPYLGEYDFISTADEVFHNRLSGPFLLMKNTQEIRKLYQGQEFIICFQNPDVECFEESFINQRAHEKYKVKLIYSTNVETLNGGKNTYDCLWSGGKVFIKNEEKMLYHFYRKNQTKFEKLGNIISAKYDKKLLDDFVWVTHFSKNYEKLIPSLVESIKKYSNRKCIFYTINYDPDFAFKFQFESDQFIFRRIDIPLGKLDHAGRSSEIMNSKPLILKNVIDNFGCENFVHIDTDIYLTVNADSITKYFDQIENYPLINSHIHDTVYLRNIIPNEEWSDPVPILLKEMGILETPVYPRRKCNVIVFNKNCDWFFEEQMKLYYELKDTESPGLFAIFDEDNANALLTKHKFQKCLPLVDIEDSYDVDMNKFTDLSHPFHSTGISGWVKLPQHPNEVLFFHNFKEPEQYESIKNVYGNTVLDQEEMVVSYKDNTLLFEKNSFLTTKKIKNEVNFIITNLKTNEIVQLNNQKIFNYWLFYISNLILKEGIYKVEIYESENNRKIFSNILKITN
jgi:hypothetical protein